jgi:hypothetical protein
MQKHFVEFELEDGQTVVVEAEGEGSGVQRVGRDGEAPTEKAQSRFMNAIARVKPAAEVVLNAFQEMNTPDEIGLEFGIKFSAKAGAILASADSEATFKVSLKWKNEK